jgi:hypothetical protein
MRRIAVLSALILTGGLLGPSTAFATEDGGPHQHRWIAVEDHFTIVLPDGTTFTDDGEESMDEEEIPPVGSQLFISEALFEAKDGNKPGAEVGRSHIECTAQVAPVYFSCDVSFVLHAGSQLHGTVVVDFGAMQDPSEQFRLDIAVTGGTGVFFGATGEVDLLDITDPSNPAAETTTLYETDLRLANH